MLIYFVCLHFFFHRLATGSTTIALECLAIWTLSNSWVHIRVRNFMREIQRANKVVGETYTWFDINNKCGVYCVCVCVWCGFILRMSGAFRRMLRAIITVVRHKMRNSEFAFMQLPKSFCLNIFPCKRWNPNLRKITPPFILQPSLRRYETIVCRLNSSR